MAVAIFGFAPIAAAGGSNAPTCDRSNTTTLGNIVTAIGADQAHARGITGAGVDVAVIDTGVNEVVGLEGRVVNGPDLSFDAAQANLAGRDLYGHGTHLAGIIAASGSAAGSGVAPGARIINVKAGAGDGSVDVSQIIAAIDWVVENRQSAGLDIRVITLAYGTDASTDARLDPLSFAVENAWRNGIVVVAAAGNDGRNASGLGNPARNPFIVAVGGAGKSTATTSGYIPATWSTKGDGVRNPDVVAPGECVISLGAQGTYLGSVYPSAVFERNGQTFLRGTGSSQSSAVVAGVVALLLEQRPNLTPDQVKAILNHSADLSGLTPVRELPGPKIAGNGLISARGALTTDTPGALRSAQDLKPGTGGGSLDAARGSHLVGTPDDQLRGEVTAFGTKFDSVLHAALEMKGATWSGASWSSASWSGASWSGASWSGASWSGASWSGASWSGASWSGASWSGASWSGASWSGASWSGASWSGASWSGASWSGAGWLGWSWS